MEDRAGLVSDPIFKYLEEWFKPECTEYAVQAKMQTPEPCWVTHPRTACALKHTAFDSAGPGRHLPALGLLGLLLSAPGRVASSGRGWRPGRGDAQSGDARRGDEPARCGHARRLGERALSGDPRDVQPRLPGQARLRPSAAFPLG